MEIFGTFLRRYLHKNEVLLTPTFYIKMNHLNIIFHMTWEKWQKFLVFKAIFQRVLFLVDPFFLRSRVWIRACFERMQLAGKALEKAITLAGLFQIFPDNIFQ